MRKTSTPVLLGQLSLKQSLAPGLRGTLQNTILLILRLLPKGGRVCEPGSSPVPRELEEKLLHSEGDRALAQVVCERTEDHICKGFLLIMSGHLKHVINKQFLPKTYYCLNNDRSCYTPLNNVRQTPRAPQGRRSDAFSSTAIVTGLRGWVNSGPGSSVKVKCEPKSSENLLPKPSQETRMDISQEQAFPRDFQ